MNRNRRTALKALAAAPLLGSMSAFAASAGGGPVNVVGVGTCGARIVRRLAGERLSVSGGDFLAAVDPGPDGGAPTFAVLGGAGAPHEGRPLVLVAGAGGPAAGERAWRRATEWSDARRGAVVPVLVLGFGWEGNYRARGLALAERFAERFGTVLLVDNQAIDEQFFSHINDTTLIDHWDRINVQVMPRIECAIAASRDA